MIKPADIILQLCFLVSYIACLIVLIGEKRDFVVIIAMAIDVAGLIWTVIDLSIKTWKYNNQ